MPKDTKKYTPMTKEDIQTLFERVFGDKKPDGSVRKILKKYQNNLDN